MAPVPEKTKCYWYEVIHDLIPTRHRLHAINLSSSDICAQCMQLDTIQHRLIQCGQAPAQWKWTQEILAIILRTSTNHILQEWLQRPSFYFWPPKRQHAVLWIIAHYVQFRIQRETELTTQDYFNFMQHTRWKLYQDKRRFEMVGNYLSVLDYPYR